ncbi:AAA family ATPase [Vibrio chagasii]|uniref:AAA family ATPase n=1 Tax=Vibrio chagasii TaxID=170679 RepID=UPI003736659A
MISKIELENFKCFDEQDFKMSSLTIFCGTNSAGKSTAIQSILMIKQNEQAIKESYMKTYGELFNFGKVSDVFCQFKKNDFISININDFQYKSHVPIDIREDFYLKLTDDSSNDVDFMSGDFVYLSAERFGPRSSFDVKRDKEKLDLGIYGQYALSEYLRIANLPAQNQKFSDLLYQKITGSEYTDKKLFSFTLINEAMKMIYPDFNIDVIKTDEIDKVHNTYSSPKGKPMRPNNVGFGVSYVLPIIIAAVAIKPGGVLIVENPEVHLHPKAQSELMSILGLLSLCDVQVIVETHSDHIVNGMRVFCKENKIDEKHTTIYSITGNWDDRSVKRINIDGDGNFTDIDDDFFDQIEKDLMRLF